MKFKLDGEIIKPPFFHNICRNVTASLIRGADRSSDGMNHLDNIGKGELRRSAFYVQARLIKMNYINYLSDENAELLQNFINAFSHHRRPETDKGEEIIELFQRNDVQTIEGQKQILLDWVQMENLGGIVVPTKYRRTEEGYFLI